MPQRSDQLLDNFLRHILYELIPAVGSLPGGRRSPVVGHRIPVAVPASESDMTTDTSKYVDHEIYTAAVKL